MMVVRPWGPARGCSREGATFQAQAGGSVLPLSLPSALKTPEGLPINVNSAQSVMKPVMCLQGKRQLIPLRALSSFLLILTAFVRYKLGD